MFFFFAQDALRKRKEEEERLAQEAEFLNRSLRGSKKLQALESTPSEKSVTPTGIVNDAYADDESLSSHHTEAEQVFHEEIHKILSKLILIFPSKESDKMRV